MVNWRTYRITSRSVSPSSYILFHLDGYVNYYNGSQQYIHCNYNYSPFNSWCVGDHIEIDNDQTCSYNAGSHYFTSANQVRFGCHHGCDHGCNHSHGDYNSLKEKYDKLEREHSDLNKEQDNWRKKYDELKDQLNNEKIKSASDLANEKLSRQATELTLGNEKKMVEEKLENFKIEKTGFLKQIEDGKKELSLVRVEKDNQLALVEGKLTQKADKLKELEKSMAELRVDNEKLISEKENSLREASGELKRKEREIKDLQSERFKTQEELLIEKLNSEKDNLEVFASELKMNLEEVHNLTKHYQRLSFARRERNRTVIEDSEGKIAKTKQLLLDSRVSIENVRKVSRECEKLATLSWELEEMQQQYEARQETTLRN